MLSKERIVRDVPISRPSVAPDAFAAVSEVLASGSLAQGRKVAEFEDAFARYVDAPYAVACSSGTTALHLALLAHGVGPGDEVITTPFTFIATANAILYCGAKPVFADIDAETLNIDPDSVERLITSKTRAILPVHLYGNPCDMRALIAICDKHHLSLIEDACQAHGALYQGQPVGSFGTGCFSFYPTKNMTCGEGGMLTTADPDIADRARLFRAHGMRIRYLHEYVGFNYRMTDIHAAVGISQLAGLPGANQKRAATAAFYDNAFQSITRPRQLPDTVSAWHQYTLRVPGGIRDELVDQLNAAGIGTGVYYPIPIHRQPAYVEFGEEASCPNAEAAAKEVFSVPVHPGVDREDSAYVVSEVLYAVR